MLHSLFVHAKSLFSFGIHRNAQSRLLAQFVPVQVGQSAPEWKHLSN
ncbi:hypothetical protein [uncultured Fibrella sp.]